MLLTNQDVIDRSYDEARRKILSDDPTIRLEGLIGRELIELTHRIIQDIERQNSDLPNIEAHAAVAIGRTIARLQVQLMLPFYGSHTIDDRAIDQMVIDHRANLQSLAEYVSELLAPIEGEVMQ